jgi:hypothetical protein
MAHNACTFEMQFEHKGYKLAFKCNKEPCRFSIGFPITEPGQQDLRSISSALVPKTTCTKSAPDVGHVLELLYISLVIGER